MEGEESHEQLLVFLRWLWASGLPINSKRAGGGDVLKIVEIRVAAFLARSDDRAGI
jgi:hypothetical protein